jgi:hypothetical protein
LNNKQKTFLPIDQKKANVPRFISKRFLLEINFLFVEYFINIQY